MRELLMICAHCRTHHDTVSEVRNCRDGSSSHCRHQLPTGQCICTWTRGIERSGTHRIVVNAKYEGFCSVCMNHYDVGTPIVCSPYTWGRWVHYSDDCIPLAHELWEADTPFLRQDALGPKPWNEDLGTPAGLLEKEDMLLPDPREEIWDTCDELQELLMSEGIPANLIEEWRAMLPDVVERTVLYEASQLEEIEDVPPWRDEVEEYVLGL